MSEYTTTYYQKNKERILKKQAEKRAANPEYGKEYYAKNRDELRAKQAEYWAENADRFNDPEYWKQYYAENKAEIYRKMRAYQKANPDVFLAMKLRQRISIAVKNAGGTKKAKTNQLTGCTYPQLRVYLEERFKPGMTWDNYGRGKGKWQIDHIIPCTAYDLTNEEAQRKCFHYTNLQPLWMEENVRKGGAY